ncbi:hypothetical protein V8D89_012116 [Ganoderma adspersum]
MVSWMGRTGLKLIGQSGLGHSFDPLVSATKDKHVEAVKMFIYKYYYELALNIHRPTTYEIEFGRALLPISWKDGWRVHEVCDLDCEEMLLDSLSHVEVQALLRKFAGRSKALRRYEGGIDGRLASRREPAKEEDIEL